MRIAHGGTKFTPLPPALQHTYMSVIEFSGGAKRRQCPKAKKMTFKQIASKISQWRRYRVSVRELSRLSDRELNDLGIGRGDIEYVARKSVRAA